MALWWCAMSDGYNPMRWDCSKRGCFNQHRRPKIEQFATCFPNRIAMSDIDATVEVNGHFLFLEMKGYQGAIPTGQRIYFERLTQLSDRIVVLVVCGDAMTMQFDAMCWVYKGKLSAWRQSSFDDVSALMRNFAAWARAAQPRIT